MEGPLLAARVVAALHDRAMRGELDGAEFAQYLSERDALMSLLLRMQRASLERGETPRRFLRVAQEMAVTLTLQEQVIQTRTLNISAGGIAIVSSRPVQAGVEGEVQLTLPAGQVQAHVRVVHASKHRDGSGRSRVGCEFLGLTDGDRARLERFVLEVVLEHLRG